MKKTKVLYVVIAILVVSQVYSIFQINSLKIKVEQTKNGIAYAEERLERNISEIYSNVDRKLEEYTSLVTSCEISEPYQYPVVPGMAEWANFKSLQEMSEACQIPDDILSNMTTEALVETVVHYPLYINAFAHDTPQMGLSEVKKYCNGLQELYTRDDAIEKIEAFIKEEIPKLDNGRKGMWAELILEDLLLQ